MRIDFLYWSGCPSHDSVERDLRETMAELGIDESAVAVRQIETEEEAVAESFPGSPTIRIDGADIQPSQERPQLTCRVYRRRDGRVSPKPDPDDLRDALKAALSTDT
jgi:hypothetical protein